MQIVTTPSIARPPSAPSAGDNAASEAAGSTSFASLLNQQPPPETSQTDGDDTAACQARDDGQAALNRSARMRAPGKPAARVAEHSVARATDATADRGSVDEARRDGPGIDGTPDPALRDWLAALHLPPPAALAPTPGGTTAVDAGASASVARGAVPVDVDAAAAQALAPVADGATAREAPNGPRATARDKSTASTQRTAVTQAATPGLEPAAANPPPGEKARLSIDTLSGVRSSPADAPAVAPAAYAPAGASERSAAACVSVPMAMPIDDAQFPRAFGVQVSVLARDGVQQAELHLNPAEMGPVSVQIVMEGTQARIDFGADAAGTRQLIEHSLPELAAALREAGLTLTGGGVSQHSSGRDDGTGQAPSGRPGDGPASGTAAADAAARPLHRTVRAGGVDLYA